MIRFIIIDDEPYVTSMFSKMLDWENLGFELAGTFCSGFEAMEWLAENKCDVIFTDIAMPDMSGTEVARLCYEKFPKILIVFFSAYRNFDYALDAIKYNVADYVIKPISQAALLETVLRLKSKITAPYKESVIDNEAHTPADEHDIIRAAKQFMAEHYHEDISITDVAKYVQFSPGYFSNYFKQKTNENFVSVLKNIRLEKAKELLKDKNVKISHIPQQIGFKSYSYFTKVFQESFGVTPTDYRNNFLNSAGRGHRNEITSKPSE